MGLAEAGGGGGACVNGGLFNVSVFFCRGEKNSKMGTFKGKGEVKLVDEERKQEDAACQSQWRDQLWTKLQLTLGFPKRTRTSNFYPDYQCQNNPDQSHHKF